MKVPACLSCMCPCGFGQLRYVMVAMSFFSIIVSHVQRSVFTIAIVEMVVSNETHQSTCPAPPGEDSIIEHIGGGKVNWNEQNQALNIAAFYIGYFIMHVPSGILIDKYGARHPLIWGLVVSTICCALTPPATMYLPWWSVFILRLLLGLGQSVQYPCLSSLVGRWIPTGERATVSSIMFGGNSIGYITGSLVSGMIINYTENWTYPFYLWSLIGIIFIGLALLYLFSDPRTHPFLNEVELEYLQDVMVQQEPKAIPIKAMLKDCCLYGLIIGQAGHDLIMFTVANNLPKYLNNVLGFSIKSNALFSFIYLAQLIAAFIFGIIGDKMIAKNWNVCFIRKLYTDLSLLLPGLAMVGVGYAKCDIVIALILLITTMFFNGLYYCGLKVHIIDVSVNHTGLMMAIINGAGSLSGFMSSTLIGYVCTKNTHEQWILVLWILLALETGTGILYTIMSTCDRRPWDYREGEEVIHAKYHRSKKCYLQWSPSSYELAEKEKEQKRRAHEDNVRAAKMKMHTSYMSLTSTQSLHRRLR